MTLKITSIILAMTLTPLVGFACEKHQNNSQITADEEIPTDTQDIKTNN